MRWKQVSIHCTAHDAERVEHLLLETGALSVTLTDAENHALLEPRPGEMPIWPRVIVTGLFDSDPDLQAVEHALRQAGGDGLAATLQVRGLQDQQWSRTWMDRFTPERYGERLWVCPSWLKPPQPDAVNLILDPGLAFGTGSHATTALCLRWLDANPPAALEVIDYGCGSGILAIAAIALGAEHCAAIDIDPQALQATEQNARRNGIDGERLDVHLPDSFAPKPADLLLANILAGPLIELAPRLTGLVKPGGRIVLSGLLAEQTDSLIQAYRPGFTLADPVLSDGWALIEGQRRLEAP